MPKPKMTPAEDEYFASGGQQTDGLGEPDAAAEAPAQEPPVPLAQPALPLPEASEGEEVTQADGGKRRMVDYRALHEERERRKALEAKVTQIDAERTQALERQARLDERLRLLSEAMAPEGQAAAVPDPDTDIFGYVKYQNQQLEELRASQAAMAEQLGERQTHIELVRNYEADARRFAAQKPDFMQAYNHLIMVRGRQLAVQGYDPKDIPRMIVEEERALVQRATEAGRSPAEVIYTIARDFGAGQPTAPAAPAAEAPNGALAPQAAVSEEISRIARGQSASRSLSMGGGQPGGTMTAERLADMPQAEFNAFMRKNPGLVKQLMGG